MAQKRTSSNDRIAQTRNVGLVSTTLAAAVEREDNLPGLVVVYGPSGFGKSVGAAVAAEEFNAYYVEVRSLWTRRSFMEGVLRALGLDPKGTLATMLDAAAQQLALSRRPLIVDEADYLTDGKSIEMVRDLHEASGAAIMLIGEEGLPQKLKRWERVHGRVLRFAAAEPAGLSDARALAATIVKDAAVEDDLLNRLVEIARGSVRRVSVNLTLVRDFARKEGLKKIDLAAWGKREFYTGEAQARRVPL